MFEPKKLSPAELCLCQNTISPNTFYMLVGDALVSGKPLSVVRMGDGERALYDYCLGKQLPNIMDADWMQRLGADGIATDELRYRLIRPATHCTHFAPSISGIQLDSFELYSLFPARARYVDNFFVNAWTEEMKIQLFKTAGHVLFIHRNTSTADAMQIRAKWGLGVKVTYLKLASWRDSESVIEKAKSIDAPLVLFSAGPASKYIGPEISTSGLIPRVTLDIGNAADYWTLTSLKDVQRI
jgi:hypothetical protein